MDDDTPTPATSSSSSYTSLNTGPSWIIMIGIAITIAALVGTAIVFDAMSNPGYLQDEASDSEKWLAVLTGLTPAGIGVVVSALGMVMQRQDRR